MTMDIYWISGSPYAWRVFLALELKGIAYNSKLLSMDQGDLKKPDFLRISPRGMVPVLVDGDISVAESLAILTYVESKFSTPSLTGQNPTEKAHIMQEMSETTYYLEPPLRQVAGAIFFDRLSGKEEEVNAAAEKLRGELDRLEKKLKSRDWLAGSAISAADIWVFPFLMIAERAAEKPLAKQLPLNFLPLAKNYPAIAAWVNRIKALPAFERTYPPHWRKQEKAA